MTIKTYEKIKIVLVERFAIDPARIYPEVDLQKELLLDSMDAVDLLLTINKLFSARIPEESLANIHTLAQLVQAVEENRFRL